MGAQDPIVRFQIQELVPPTSVGTNRLGHLIQHLLRVLRSRQVVEPIKTILKRVVPLPFVNMYRKAKLARLRRMNEAMSLKDTFTRIYSNSEWGGDQGQYCSGSGSSEFCTSLYVDLVRGFIKDKRILTVVDLGCGDFRVGRKLQMDGVQYLGVDIVDDLIEQNQRSYGTHSITFQCLDIVSDELPDADLCLIRQVLQHLSNSEIISVLHKTKKYKYVMITEHYPAPSVKTTPNIDKPHGPDIRVYDGSAVYLDKPPFNLSNSRMMLEIEAVPPLVKEGEKIRTFLIEK